MERLPCSRMAEQSASVDDSPRWLACGRMRGSPRGGSSAGRASRSQCEGREFDPPPLHQIALKRNGPLSRPVRVMEAPIYLPAPVPDDDAPPVPPVVLEPVPVPRPPPPSEPLELVPAPAAPDVLPPMPLDVLPDVPPAPLTLPSSRRHRSFSRPVRVAQRELDAPAPVLAEPLGLLPMLLPLLPPMGLPVLPPMGLPVLPPTLLPVLPPTLLPVLLPLPMLPLGLDDVCAIAPKAKRAAAVALTNSFNLMNCSCN